MGRAYIIPRKRSVFTVIKVRASLLSFRLREPASLHPTPFHHPLLSRRTERFTDTENLLTEEKERSLNTSAAPRRGLEQQRRDTRHRDLEC